MRFARSALAVFTLALAACDPAVPPGDGGTGTDAPAGCSDERCDDGMYCNGVERCEGGACADGDPPCGDDGACDEAGDRCATPCDLEPDADGDGVSGAACGGSDCDDADPTRFPGAVEVCDADDVDEDCDPGTFGARDADGDGSLDAECCNDDGAGRTVCGDDCDDARTEVHPGSVELCDARDGDCDGAVDEDPDQIFYRDVDGDGYGILAMTVRACSAPAGYAVLTGDCDDTRSAVNPGNPELCNLRDDNCDGSVDEMCGCAPDGLSEACGPMSDEGECRFGTRDCIAGTWSSCAGAIEPGIESCEGAADEDCDATVDEGCECTNGTTRTCGSSVGVCRSVEQSCSMGSWPRDCADEPSVVMPRTETCDGALDEDCDGAIDEGCACTNGTVDRTACGTDAGECVSGMRVCAMGAWGACSGGVGPRPEVCDGARDENCDGAIDEGCACVDGTTRPCGMGACAGTQTCAGGTYGACSGAAPGPELCNGVDNDCDGLADNVDPSTMGVGASCGTTTGLCTLGMNSCPGTMLVCSGTPPVAETCDHRDQDCDGSLDDGVGPATCTFARTNVGGMLQDEFLCEAGCFEASDGSIELGNGDGPPQTAALRASMLPDWGAQMSVQGRFAVRNTVGSGFALGTFGVFVSPRSTPGSEANEGLPTLTGIEHGFAALYDANPLVQRLRIWESTASGVILQGEADPLPSSCFLDDAVVRAMTITLSNNAGTITATLDAGTCGTRTVAYVDTTWQADLYGDSETSPYPRYQIGAVGNADDRMRIQLTAITITRTRTSSRPHCVACPW